jgi:hypothetical protein
VRVIESQPFIRRFVRFREAGTPQNENQAKPLRVEIKTLLIGGTVCFGRACQTQKAIGYRVTSVLNLGSERCRGRSEKRLN